MSCIRQVWSNSLEAAFEDMSDIVQYYPYVAVNAVFCGYVTRPIEYEEYAYQTVKYTVDLSHCLQIAFAFADGAGRVPPGKGCYQFNFSLNERVDIALEVQLDSFKQNSLDSTKTYSEGILLSDFGSALVKSGLLVNPDIHWVTYNGAYDFGYILRSVTNSYLPASLAEYKEDLSEYFTSFYDVRHMLAFADSKLRLSYLRQTASQLNITDLAFINDPDFGNRAGNHALIIAILFFRSLQLYYNNKIDEEMLCGKLFGLETSPEELLELAYTAGN